MKKKKGYGKHSKAIEITTRNGEPVAIISIGKRKQAIISLVDIDVLLEHSFYAQKRTSDGNYVARSWQTGELLHRLIMKPEKTQEVDHVSAVTLDNTRGNLRVCTRRQNLVAKHYELVGGMRGVKKTKTGIIKAYDYELNKYVGKFKTVELAGRYRDESALEAFKHSYHDEPLHSYSFIGWNFEEPEQAKESEEFLAEALNDSKINGYQLAEERNWSL